MTDDRLLTGKRRKEDQDQSLRPQLLSQVIGQERVVENLKILVSAAKARKEPLDHILFYGPPGIGKTTLSTVMGKEMGVNVRPTAGPAIERAGDLAAILTHLREGDILFIDEIHRLGKAVGEILYPAMEDFVLDIVVGKGPAAKNVRLNLPRFTVIGATTRLALLSSALRSRFGAIYRLDFYSLEAMNLIVKRAAEMLRIPTDEGGASEIASRARGTPRIALRLLKRVRDFAQVRGDGTITRPIADEALDLLNVDHLGLDDIDRRVLISIIEKGGGPIGLETIAAAISEESDTIMDVCEPYLIQLGFLDRTPRGRTVTRKAYEHLKIPYNGRDDQTSTEQNPLF
ncbi:MAG: Holliday junction branch migration DNA helicase RuvB [Anaerolineae bacterium]|nr:Holliday junction branch migration DNA helicase RuvB [Anaerolineae bacterium]CAG0987609.1 Holliday junction ATP-dependent DNA helicase RuvB [Anaerolineae bacterium]